MNRALPMAGALPMNCALLAAALLCTLLCATPSQAAVRTLLAIGNDEGLADEAPLRWAEVDAARLRDVFVELGGVSPPRATLLQGATVVDVIAELARVRGQIEEVKRRGERAELFVTYSGHGDDGALHLAGERLSFARLDALLAAIPADAVVVIVDACRTGPVRSGAVRGASRGPAFDVTLIKDAAPTGRVRLSSASRGEVAQESDDVEGAWFTHHVTAGLRGAADVDGDGAVSLAEIYRHAWSRTVSQSFDGGGVQHPQLSVDLQGEGELALTRLDRAAATLTLAPSLQGSFLIVDDRRGDVIVEVEKATGAALSLAVPPRRLRLQQRDGARSRVAGVDVARGSRVVVDDDDFAAVVRVAGRSRGRDVDPSPWGVQAGYVVSTPPALVPWVTGAWARGEVRVVDSDVFVDGGVVFVGGAGSDDVASFAERDVRLWLGVGYELWTPVGRVVVGAAPGWRFATQDSLRNDHARLEAAGLDDVAATSTWTSGPLGQLSTSFSVPLVGPFSVVANAAGHVAVDVRDGAIDVGFGAGFGVGLGAEL